MDNSIWVANYTEQLDFILMGLFSQSKHPALLCVVIFVIFLMALSGNSILILLIHSNAHLQTPMYFFISQLSLMDVMYISVTVPKMLMDQVMGKNKISAPECGMQMFFYVTLGGSEYFLLAAMAYDRYVAIYDPLLYSISMAPRVYVPLIIASYVGGIVHATVHTVATFSLSFCASNEIRHVFCDIPPLLAISCSDTRMNQLLVFYFAGSIEIVTVLIVLISYGFILLTVLRMPSTVERRKVFSTCGSHLTGVSICHGTVLFMYVRPSSSYATDHDMIVSIIYSIVIPMLNPIIYSLRNKDVKDAMKKVLGKNWFINKVYFSH